MGQVCVIGRAFAAPFKADRRRRGGLKPQQYLSLHPKGPGSLQMLKKDEHDPKQEDARTSNYELE